MLFRFKRLDREVHVLLYSISPQQKLSCTSRKKMSKSVKKEKALRAKSPLAADMHHSATFRKSPPIGDALGFAIILNSSGILGYL